MKVRQDEGVAMVARQSPVRHPVAMLQASCLCSAFGQEEICPRGLLLASWP